MKTSEFRKLIREEIQNVLAEGPYTVVTDKGQGSGSQSITQKGTPVAISALKPGMSVIVKWIDNGGAGSGSQSFNTNAGVIKSVAPGIIHLEVDDYSNFTKAFANIVRRKGLPIPVDTISKVTAV